MSDILYYKVELNGELAGLFQSDSEDLAAIQIAQLKISQPELTFTSIDGNEYYELLDFAMPEQNSW